LNKPDNITPTFFSTQKGFRKWLQKNHETAAEIVIGFYKVGSGKPSITWSQSVDEALCFGWIDAVRKSIDKDSYQIRFTRRKPASIWSSVNIKKIEELTRKGLMQPAGMASFGNRQEKKSGIYAHENAEIQLSPGFKKLFKAEKTAWHYFQSLAASYKKLSTHWVMSAKQEATRVKRLNELINDCKSLTNKWKDNKYKKSKS
jgi:uncharacterized protein YdeI (YjbR/CyaY-like superfamily)